ncbi:MULTISPECIES: hypothetical protein [Bradyrhizobium]|uniref:hypothetical protein n=1 Tax=Bradyrhizobium TaxID=374 RepID=UPI0003FDAC25|nr:MULTISPECIES: hypothetical protein [Bradyrhizobium]OCX32893.1 hypothetical protein QU42_01590 [Bradyrhizobium sp. UASWS1016]
MPTDLGRNAIFTPGGPSDGPPVGDAEREAIASLGGYTYQVAAAALAWLDLPDGARLYLEVAEDYATLAEQVLSAVQVKDTAGSGSVTLNSENVRDAVNAFVGLVASNPGRQIAFRYFTTSAIGTERKIEDRPGGQPGLAYWRKAAAGADVAPLRAILLSGNYSEAVHTFVGACDDTALRRDLLQKIHWDCGKPDLAAVTTELQERLVVLGRDRFQLAAPEARRLADIVMVHVLRKSVLKKSDDRVLTRAELYAVIDDATRVSMPRGSVDAMARLASSLSNAFAGTGSAFSVDQVGWIVSGRDLAAPRGVIARHALQQKALNTLTRCGALVLVGASGLGKSLVARNVAHARDVDFTLIDLRDLEADEMRQRLDYFFGRIGASLSQVTIFEDLNHLEDPGVSLSFGRVMAALGRRDRTAVVTCYRKPTVSSLSKVGFDPAAIADVPYFSEEETRQVVRENGGDPEVWGNVAHAAGGFGHPQLVHAFAVGMAVRNWPTSDLRELVSRGLSSDDIEAAREAARRQLAAQLPEPARRLLYRLSLVTNRFDRPLALRIASLPPPVPSAGDHLDMLVGPWIEAAGDHRYRVSPLAGQSGHNSLTADEQREIHAAIASHMLQQGQLNVSDANAAFLHALAGQFEPGLSALSRNVITSRDAPRALLAEHFFALRVIRTDRPIYPRNPTLSILLRMAQFRLAAASGDGDEIRSTVGAMLEEVKAAANIEGGTRFVSLMYSMVLNTMGIANHLPNWFELLRQFRAAVENDTEMQHLKNRMEGDTDGKPVNFYGALFSVGATGLSSVEGLEEVVNDLMGVDDDERRMWLTGYEQEQLGFSTFVNGPWAAEHKRDAVNAQDAAERFRRMAAATRDWGLRALTVQFHVARAVMLDEYGRTKEAALAALDEAEAALGPDIALDRARAKIYWRDDRFADALEIWRHIADRLPKESAVERAFSLREAAINAAKTGDWEQSEKWFLDAESSAAVSELDGMESMSIGLAADAAVAAFHAGSPARALTSLARALQGLGHLDPNQSLKAAYCHRVVRHAILWLQTQIERREAFIDGEPIQMMPGTCSNPEPPDATALPLGPIDMAWYLLAEAEIASDVDVGIYASLRNRLKDGPIPVLEVGVRNHLMTRDVERQDAAGLADHLVGFLEGLAFTKAGGEALRTNWDVFAPPRGELPALQQDETTLAWADTVASDCILAFGMLAALSGHEDAITALEKALRSKLGSRYAGKAVLEKCLTDSGAPTELDEAVAGLLREMNGRAHIEPQDVWGIGLRFFEKARHSNFRKLLVPKIAGWLRAATQRIIDEESFRLTRPRQAIPELEAVLANKQDDAAFVAALLITLSDAVGSALGSTYRSELKHIADGNSAAKESN